MRSVMCIVPANYQELQDKGVASHIFQRDLNGYWDKVITVHPFCKYTRRIDLSNKHVILEYRLGDLLLIFKLWHIIRKEKLVVIKAHDPYYTGVIAYILSLISRIPYVIMICSSYDLMAEEYGRSQLRYKWLDSIVGRFTMSHALAVFGGSIQACKWASENGARNVELVRTGGIAEAHFVKPEQRERWHEDKKIVLYVGRLDAIKYPEDAFKAYEMIKEKYPDTVMWVAGDGNLKEQLKTKYQETIKWLGFINTPVNMASIMAMADVALVPLGGSALVELMLAGVPIVAYDVDWHSEIIHDGASVLVPFRDLNSMANEAIKILSDSEKAKEMGRKAREIALAQHSLEVVQKHEALCFDKILGRRT